MASTINMKTNSTKTNSSNSQSLMATEDINLLQSFDFSGFYYMDDTIVDSYFESGKWNGGCEEEGDQERDKHMQQQCHLFTKRGYRLQYAPEQFISCKEPSSPPILSRGPNRRRNDNSYHNLLLNLH